MTGAKHDWLLWAALLVSVLAYQLWPYLPVYHFGGMERKPYYIGIALFIAVMAVYIYLNSKRFVAFILMGLAVNNVVDETLANPLEFGVNEFVLLVIIAVYWFADKSIIEYNKLDD